MGLLRSLKPHKRAQWGGIPDSRETLALLSGDIEKGLSATAELVGLAEIAGMGSTCGLANQAAAHARNLVGLLFQKSIEQGCFPRDVRMSPADFDEFVFLTEPHLPRGLRAPVAIPPTWRIFALLFWLSPGCPNRVTARAVDVAESTFPTCCSPVIRAMLAALPVPSWPSGAERLRITRDFSEMTGGNTLIWAGL